MNIDLIFISEQDGAVEREFKHALMPILANSNTLLRAYLAKAKSHTEHDNVVLALRTKTEVDFTLLNQCSDVFKNMFAQSQHLDTIFITGKQEQTLRQLCCPFFTSLNQNVDKPDFYLRSSESKLLTDVPRACFMRKRLYGDRQDGYLLCDITPGIIGQPFGLGEQDIHQVVLANRLEGDSLFPISTWPISVYVTRVLNKNLEFKETVEESDVGLIAWAELDKQV